jgi:hypothetical protein
MVGSTFSGTIAAEVTLGTGVFLSPLTITASARIKAPAETTSLQTASAIYVGSGIVGASILNFGQVSGMLPQFDSVSIPALLAESPLNLHNYGTVVGQSGIYLDDGGTITNAGLIAGSDARSQHDYGIRLFNGSLINTGTVYGAKYGVTNWNLSEISNSGTILGDLAGVDLISTTLAYGGTLLNQGSIYAKQTGITASGALITNAGTVTGETYGIRISWGSTITNSGSISGGLDGVLLLNQQYQTDEDSGLVNSGHITGGYFGLAINFSRATNTAGGTISGQTFGVGIGEGGYFYNAGSVYGANAGLTPENGGLGVNAGTIRGGTIGGIVFAGGDVTNVSTGYFRGGNTGIRDQGGYLLNNGTVTGGSYGLYLLGGGIVVNSGKITSPGEGICLSSRYSTASSDFLVNTGTVYGKDAGMILKNGTVYNLGTISGGPIGVSLVAGTSLSNSGVIYGQKYGVQLAPAGILSNTGTITGGKTGVQTSHDYLFNSATISGGTYAIYGQGFTLGVGAGDAFSGKVFDRSDTSTLDLTGLAFGTLAGLGTAVVGFDEINFVGGAEWLLSGNSAGLAAHQVINGFTYGDTIILTGFTVTTVSSVSDNGILLSNGKNNVSLAVEVHFNTNSTPYEITASSLGTVIMLPVPCFATGTRILTSRGKIIVENLCQGETIITLAGEERPIMWIGKKTIDIYGHPQPGRVQPICITANALAENVPDRDLWVSPDHAIYIDGYLIPAKELLNRYSIYQHSRRAVTYYHIELARHAIIFAENAAVETYLDTGNKAGFENGSEALSLHPDFGDILRRRRSCAVLLDSGDALDEIRARIRVRCGHPSLRISGNA